MAVGQKKDGRWYVYWREAGTDRQGRRYFGRGALAEVEADAYVDAARPSVGQGLQQFADHAVVGPDHEHRHPDPLLRAIDQAACLAGIVHLAISTAQDQGVRVYITDAVAPEAAAWLRIKGASLPVQSQG
jgi:hypothetical protein